MVDTAAQDVERRGDGGVCLLTQDLHHLVVGAVGSDILAVGAHEDGGQRRAVRDLLVGLGEHAYVVVGTRLHGLVRTIHRLDESGIVLTLARERLDQILNFDFEHHVHTALKVETEVELLLLALLVSVVLQAEKTVNGLIHDRIEIISLGGCSFSLVERLRILCGGLLHASRFERERELVEARDHQYDREQFNCAFTLHCRQKFCLYF